VYNAPQYSSLYDHLLVSEKEKTDPLVREELTFDLSTTPVLSVPRYFLNQRRSASTRRPASVEETKDERLRGAVVSSAYGLRKVSINISKLFGSLDVMHGVISAKPAMSIEPQYQLHPVETFR
jgi:hypothetical protein